MHKACLLAELAHREARRLKASPPVFHPEDGKLLATDDTCTQQDASLADGWVEGYEVGYPRHASTFYLRTGRVDAPPAKLPVRTHEVSVHDGDIMLTASTEVPDLLPGLTVNGHI